MPAKTTATKSAATPGAVPPEGRHVMIAESAFIRAEQRGFQGGDAVGDWLLSEKEVDTLLLKDALGRMATKGALWKPKPPAKG